MKRYLKTAIIYYFYHHGIMGEDRIRLENAINDHDYETFKEIIESYGSDKEMFPRTATIFNQKNDDVIGEVDVFNEVGFNMIDECDSEFG